MTKYKIHNGSFRTKAFKVHGGTEDVLPGKTRTIDVQGGLTPEFITKQGALGVKIEEVKAGKEHAAGDDKPMTAADVLAMAGGNFMAFKSAAAKLLGENTPSKKDEIVAALEELATAPAD